jgi:hypothetical protein
VSRLLQRGPYARLHWQAVLLCGVVPMVLLMLPVAPSWHVVAALASLLGLYVEEDILVRAGQALPIS